MGRLDNQLYLYRAMRKHGIENFSFQILEENIPIEELNKKEIDYINEYKSNNSKYGYNLTNGGRNTHSTKLNENIVLNIINTIKEHNEYSFEEIAKLYGVNRSTISDINNGDTWNFENIEYPIKNSIYNNLISDNEVRQIYELLKQNKSYTEISEIMNVSIAAVGYINNGKTHKLLPDECYPITKAYNSKKNLSVNQIDIIINYILKHPKIIYRELCELILEKENIQVSRKTLSGINKGDLYLKQVLDLGYDKFPLKDNYSFI